MDWTIEYWHLVNGRWPWPQIDLFISCFFSFWFNCSNVLLNMLIVTWFIHTSPLPFWNILASISLFYQHLDTFVHRKSQKESNFFNFCDGRDFIKEKTRSTTWGVVRNPKIRLNKPLWASPNSSKKWRKWLLLVELTKYEMNKALPNPLANPRLLILHPWSSHGLKTTGSLVSVFRQRNHLKTVLSLSNCLRKGSLPSHIPGWR